MVSERTAQMARRREAEIDYLILTAFRAAEDRGFDVNDCHPVVDEEDGSCVLMIGDRPFAVIEMDEETLRLTLRFFLLFAPDTKEHKNDN